ncbi:hAT family dimerization domain-containing protein [Arabidopsis thaliana]|nr:hAT family dimerization domain-containing protein [Arabidopsis thaliana]ANM62505.1 hAT family dimerization domain-containing protein [Arabidopsis thaliana]|eukprot:NP_001324658.1 hAT family dimerization domain-containing protein [Arabidopsis thaliana]
MDQALYSLETRFEQFQSFGCICGKKFFKAEIDKILSSFEYVTRKVK